MVVMVCSGAHGSVNTFNGCLKPRLAPSGSSRPGAFETCHSPPSQPPGTVTITRRPGASYAYRPGASGPSVRGRIVGVGVGNVVGGGVGWSPVVGPRLRYASAPTPRIATIATTAASRMEKVIVVNLRGIRR